MKFTDSEGREYEEVYPNSDPKVFENIIIRPVKQSLDIDILDLLNNYPREMIEEYLKDRPVVKQQPKYRVVGPYLIQDNRADWGIDLELTTSEDQAQLIKQSVEELLGKIFAEKDPDEYNRLYELVDLARLSMRENN